MPSVLNLRVLFDWLYCSAITEHLSDIYSRRSVNDNCSLCALTSVKLFSHSPRANSKGATWRNVGSYRAGQLRMRVITWPAPAMTSTLRVATNIAPPFVMEHDAVNGSCVTSVPCLRLHNASGRDALDDIFADYNGNRNQRRHQRRPINAYDVMCCQGLSINILQSLAHDMNFKMELYITADGRYGDYSAERGSWNGLVHDVESGVAHMAIAPFSITHNRSGVIDFTQPYFYSGFSFLVSETKRKTRLYAFMEPFDGFVWISIVVSATVVAVVLAVFEWRSPFGLNPWGRKRKSNYTLGSGLNMVYAILFGHTVKTKSPKAWPSKWLQNFWAGASIFIYSSYTANLAAFLAGKNSGVIVSGIYDPMVRVIDIVIDVVIDVVVCLLSYAFNIS